MNNTIIDIPKIHLSQRNIYLEHSPDSAYLLYIKDEHDTEITVTIINGKIISVIKEEKV